MMHIHTHTMHACKVYTVQDITVRLLRYHTCALTVLTSCFQNISKSKPSIIHLARGEGDGKRLTTGQKLERQDYLLHSLAGYAIMSAFSLGIVLLFVNSWQECSC